MLHKDELYLVALSGGADSVCLLRCLKALGYRLEAIHCNFRLRGEESDRDELFCQELCRKLDVPLHLAHFDTRSYAELHHVSIEMAARELRYAHFKNLCKDMSAGGVCVGHHQEDSVETILINLVRSTGIHGLTGIAPENDCVYRPLLCVSRKEITDYLQTIQQNYITDSTNLVADVQRNKMRLEVVPLLESINPAAQQNILQTALRLVDVVSILDGWMERVAQWKPRGPYWYFPLKEVTHEYILWYLLKNHQFTSKQVGNIYENRNNGSGRVWTSKTHELLIDRGQLVLARRDDRTRKTLILPEPGLYRYDATLKVRLSVTTTPISAQTVKDKRCAYMDFDQVSFPLVLRPVQPADRFQPFGMKGTKLLSDYMTDRKMSLFEKRRQLVLTDHQGHILWVLEERLADPYKMTTATQTVLKVEMLHE